MPLKFSLVIPTYNEAVNIAKLCRKIINVLDRISLDFEIIIVDDNSPDGTWRIAEDLAKQDLRIKLVRRMRARGLGSAVVSGWEVSQGEILGVMDADLQHPPEILEEMLNQIFNHQEIDIVVASRYAAGGGIENSSFWQILRPQLAIFLGAIFVPKIFKSVKDPMSGYFILRKKVISGIQLRPLGYKILLEVLAMGSYKKVYELPYSFAVREAGRTKSGWKQYFIFLLQLIKLKIKFVMRQ
ncbi:MAG: polyprenol monophosphomannose synthase [Candidatus Omnitrophica bacterium]|nr:polyprenol monophosphomannose synthase [Candidatus Omnitrophota bacterium]